MPSSSGSEQAVKVDRDRDKRIKDSIEESNRIHGKGTVMRLGDKSIPVADVFPTGSLSVDVALGSGCGGAPRGYITEMFGPEGGGKSTLALQIIAEANKRGEDALYVDSENSLNLQYAANLGVKVDRLLVCQPDYGEQGFQVIQNFIKNEAVGVAVIDSVAMLLPKAEYEGEIGDAGVGQQSRMVSQALRVLNNDVRKSKVALICINQIREKIGVTYGNPETTPAGHLLKHMSSIRMDIRRIASLKNGDKIIGGRVKAKIVKNKFSPPFVDCEFDLIYGEGVSREAEVIDLGTEAGVVVKDGNYFTYKGERLGLGREKSRLFLKQTPAIFKEAFDETRKKLLGR